MDLNLPSHVTLHVERQVIGPREAAIAVAALERLGTCVLAVVAGQLVAPRKPPFAAVPGALVRLLTCNGREGGKLLLNKLHFKWLELECTRKKYLKN